MDPLSIAGSTAALLHVFNNLLTYAHGVFQSTEDRARLATAASDLKHTLNTLNRRGEKATRQPEDAWYQGALALMKTATPDVAQKGRFIPDISGLGDGLLIRVHKAMLHLLDELEKKGGLNGAVQRIRWPSDKKRFQEILDQITTWTSQIDSILHHDHFELSLALRVLAKDTNLRVQENHKLLVDHDKQLAELTAYMKLSNNRELRKEKDEEREAVIQWLSKLDFRHRHKEIYQQSYQTSSGKLRSEEFQAWMSGRPCTLVCYGMPGSGKVQYPPILHLQEISLRLDCALVSCR